MNILGDLTILFQIQDIEKRLNAFIEAVNEHNGKVWLQDYENKDLIISLSKPMKLNYYYSNVTEDEVVE